MCSCDWSSDVCSSDLTCYRKTTKFPHPMYVVQSTGQVSTRILLERILLRHWMYVHRSTPRGAPGTQIVHPIQVHQNECRLLAHASTSTPDVARYLTAKNQCSHLGCDEHQQSRLVCRSQRKIHGRMRLHHNVDTEIMQKS